MKKLLIASTALSLAGGAAFAEMAVTVSGDAEMGVDYNSEPGMTDDGMTKSKHTFVHEVGIDFSGSGTTDGGLTFGGSAGFDTGDSTVNEGTVHVSGSFGTLTIGDNDSADVTAGGIADIGLNGIGVDDKVEGLRGGTANQLRYDNSFGQISIAISAGTKNGSAAVAEIPGTPAVDPTAWTITDHNGAVHSYPVNYSRDENGMVMLKDKPNTLPGTPDDDLTAYAATDFEMLFGIVARSEAADAGSVLIDLDGVTTGDDADDDQHNIYGFKREKDDTVTKPGEGDARAKVTDEDEIAAFERYEAIYSLGADEMVGGANVAATDDAAEVINVDSVREGVVTDNRVAAGDSTPAIPAGKSETEFAFGMSFEAGGVTIGVGYDSNKTVSMGAGFSTGEISTNLLYVKMDDDEDTMDKNEEATGMGVDMTYTMGASAVTLAYGRHKPEMGEATDAVGMGVTHDLGGGATMNAGFGKVDESNKASIGLSFAF